MIVDIVDTGNTLRANGIEPREEIASGHLAADRQQGRACARATGAGSATLVDAIEAAVPAREAPPVIRRLDAAAAQTSKQQLAALAVPMDRR
jgi:ATP phosphoribosyltransferase